MTWPRTAASSAASSQGALATTWCIDWGLACTRSGAIRAAIGSTLLRSPGSSSPLEQARAGSARRASPRPSTISSRYAPNRSSLSCSSLASCFVTHQILRQEVTQSSYNRPMVLDLLHRIGVPVSPRRSLAARLESREPDELTINELAALLATPQVTIHSWVTRGVVTARQVQVSNHGLWLIRMNEAELNRLRERRNGRARLSVNPHEA